MRKPAKKAPPKAKRRQLTDSAGRPVKLGQFLPAKGIRFRRVGRKLVVDVKTR